MKKDDEVYVGHMLESAQQAGQLVSGVDRATYDTNITLKLALAHLLQIIGEAGRRVSKPYCEAHPNVPWSVIIGMRHKIVHDYLNVDYDIVWQTVTNDLPPLIAELEKIIP